MLVRQDTILDQLKSIMSQTREAELLNLQEKENSF